MIKLLATDLDGTLFSKSNIKEIIEEENIILLRLFHNMGGNVAVVSGRGSLYCKWVSKKLGFECYDLSLNGAYNGFSKTAKTIPNKSILSILEKLKEYNKPYTFLLSSSDGIMYALKNRFFMYSYKYLKQRNKKYVNRISKTIFSNQKIRQIIKNNQVCKVLIYFKNKDDHHNFYSYIQEFQNDLSLYYYNDSYEINAKECSKGLALEELMKQLKIKEDEVLVIGDGKNDISMLERFNNAFTFTYSSDQVKKSAKIIIEKFKDIENYLY